MLFDARDYISGDPFKIVRCGNCQVVFTRPVPAVEAWSRYYPLAYYGAAGTKRFPGPVEWLQRQLYAARIRRLEKFNGGRPGRVLDVGCGRGFLLQEFQRRGWEVLGTEADDKAATHARDVLKLPVKVGPLDAMEPPGAASMRSCSGMCWSISPTRRRRSSRFNACCAQVGVLLVGVPNFGSWEARLCRDKWFHLDVPRHLAHFTPDSLGSSLSKAGLRLCGRGMFAPEYDIFSFVQSFLSRIGLRHNYLYNLLRGRGSKVIGSTGGQWGQFIGTLVIGVPLAVVSLPATFIAGLLGQGSAITGYAKNHDRFIKLGL